MAKEKAREGIFVEKPKADVYLVLIIITTVAMLLATAIMWLENSSLS